MTADRGRERSMSEGCMVYALDESEITRLGECPHF